MAVISSSIRRTLLLRQRTPLYNLARTSTLDSKSKRVQKLKAELAHKGRLKPLAPDHDKDMLTYQLASETGPSSRIYTFGMAMYGALGVREYLRPPKGKRRGELPRTFDTMNRPARCSALEREDIVDVACGYGFTVFGCKKSGKKKHHLYGTGLNRDAQIGKHTVRHGGYLEALIEPVPISLPEVEGKVAQVSAGRAHTLAVFQSGEVLAFGNNAYGQCGRKIIPDEDYFKAGVVTRVKGPWTDDERIVGVTCGQDHSIFRSDRGRLFSCGWSADGQTGLGHYENQDSVALVGGDVAGEKVVKVACAADCVLAVNDRGELFGWGNSEYGQFLAVTGEQQLNVPTHLKFDGIGKIKDIASGGTVCMVLNEDHDVFVWGYGILGKGPKLARARTPQLIPPTVFGRNELNPDVRVTSIACGLNSMAAITSLGELYMWGKNRAGCLGLGSFDDQYFPFKVGISSHVLKVSLGVDHTAVLCKSWT